MSCGKKILMPDMRARACGEEADGVTYVCEECEPLDDEMQAAVENAERIVPISEITDPIFVPSTDVESSSLVPLRINSMKTREQAAFLRAMATQIESDLTVEKIALVLAIKFDDGTVICPANGFVDDMAVSRYFSSFVQSRGGIAS